MAELGEALGGRGADALGRRVGQGAVLRLERLQLAEQRVVVRVLDLGGVVLVVEPVVALDLARQRAHALARIGSPGGHSRETVTLRVSR